MESGQTMEIGKEGMQQIKWEKSQQTKRKGGNKGYMEEKEGKKKGRTLDRQVGRKEDGTKVRDVNGTKGRQQGGKEGRTIVRQQGLGKRNQKYFTHSDQENTKATLLISLTVTNIIIIILYIYIYIKKNSNIYGCLF